MLEPCFSNFALSLCVWLQNFGCKRSVIELNGILLTDVLALAASIGELTTHTRRARTAMWCALQMASNDVPHLRGRPRPSAIMAKMAAAEGYLKTDGEGQTEGQIPGQTQGQEVTGEVASDVTEPKAEKVEEAEAAKMAQQDTEDNNNNETKEPIDQIPT